MPLKANQIQAFIIFSTFPCLMQFIEHNTVRYVNLHFRSVHHHGSSLQIHMEECHIIAFMVQGHKELIIREQICILRIFSADGQTEILCKGAILRIYFVNYHGIVSGIGGEQILVIFGVRWTHCCFLCPFWQSLPSGFSQIPAYRSFPHRSKRQYSISTHE